MAKKPPKPATQSAPDFVEAATLSEDKLEAIRTQLREVRDTTARIGDLQSVVGEENKKLQRLTFETLPEMFAAAGIDSLGLPAEGNNPPFEAKLNPFYRANIAASWDEERRAAAFKLLESLGAASLIKTFITIEVPREDRKKVKEITAALRKMKCHFEVEASVHSGTLTAFVREQLEEGRVLPLDVLGASVGNIVKMKERK